MYVIRYVDSEGGWYADRESRVRTSETAYRFPTWQSAERAIADADLEGVTVEQVKTYRQLEEENIELRRFMENLRLSLEDRQHLKDLKEFVGSIRPYRKADVWMYPATDKEESVEFMANHARQSTRTEVWGVYLVEESMAEGDIDGVRYVEHCTSSAITGNGPRSETHAYFYALLHNWAPALVKYMTLLDNLSREE